MSSELHIARQILTDSQMTEDMREALALVTAALFLVMEILEAKHKGEKQ